MTVLRTTLGLTSFAKGGGAASTGLGLVSVADGGGVALDDAHPIIWLPVPNSRSRPSPLEPTAVPGVFSNLQFAESGSQEVCCRYPCPDRVARGVGGAARNRLLWARGELRGAGSVGGAGGRGAGVGGSAGAFRVWLRVGV